MNLQNLKEIILKYKDKILLRGQQSYQLTQNKLLFKEINSKYDNVFKSVQEIIYLIENFNNLENLHIFCRCGNKNNFIRYKIGYNMHCCHECSNSDPDVILKNSINVSKACNNKTKEEKAIISNKMIITKQNRTKEQKQITFERQSAATKRMWNSFTEQDITNLGNKISKAHANRTLEQKREAVLKHNNTMNLKTDEEKRLILEKISKKLRMPEVQKRIINTKKKNGTCGNRSKSEMRCYELLKSKFSDTEHSYIDEKRYPFNCDIYVPELDLFVECHFGIFHYKKPFNPNNKEHLKQLNDLKIKEQLKIKSGQKLTQYTQIIQTWTKRDPLKLKTFIDNKLNYKIFYTEEEFIEWFNSL
jgi:hypothetical protein